MFGSTRKMTDEEGFTLVELVVVMGIVGALSAGVMVSVGGLTHRARASACNADVQAVSVAGDAFIALSSDGRPARSLDSLVIAGFLVADPGDVTYTPSATSFTAVGNARCS